MRKGSDAGLFIYRQQKIHKTAKEQIKNTTKSLISFKFKNRFRSEYLIITRYIVEFVIKSYIIYVIIIKTMHWSRSIRSNDIFAMS